MAATSTRRSWIDAQKNTFTGWANTFLKEKRREINNFDTDLQDGVNLINLLESIFGKKLPENYANPSTRLEKIYNVNVAIQFIQAQGIKLSFEAQHIADGNVGFTIELIRTLILQYQISNREALLALCRERLQPYDIQVKNFNSSWRDGRALCALTDSLKVGCLPMSTLSKVPEINAHRAISTAHELFGIPKIIDACDLVTMDEFDLSIMTYLSYFRDYVVNVEKADAKKHDAEKQTDSEDEEPICSSTPEIFVPDSVQCEEDITEQLKQFEEEFSKIEERSDSEEPICSSTPEILSSQGGAMTLDDGASLLVCPGTSESVMTLSISSVPPETVAAYAAHDSVEGSKVASAYFCEPHGNEFTKPVLLKLPYDASIPIDRLGVFHMKTNNEGQPYGSWEMMDAHFNGSVAQILTTHFSAFAVFEFTSASLQKRAKLRCTKSVSDIVYPGLTYRGKCKKCKKDVNHYMGFGTFAPQDDVEKAQKQPGPMICPLCKSNFVPDRFLLYDTAAKITKILHGGLNDTKDHEISDSEAVCFGIVASTGGKKHIFGGKSHDLFKQKIVCKQRPNSTYGVDICFVMDCTGSMDPFIDAARAQIMEIATRITQDVQQSNIGLICKVRMAFVGYRDYIYYDETGEVEIPDDLVYTADFSENLASIEHHISLQCAYGGADTCEDLVGGLKAAVGLAWRGTMRAVVVITDAPCHGREFHSDNVVDSFPDNNPSGHPKDILEQMLRSNINFFFLKITNDTDIMIDKFRVFYDRGQHSKRDCKIEVLPMGQNTLNMGNLIQGGIMKTINANINM